MADPQLTHATSPQDDDSMPLGDASFGRKPSAPTALGLLPTEILEMVMGNLYREDLPSLARISTVFHALAEKLLYREVLLPVKTRRQVWVQDIPNTEYWPLFRTLCHRVDIAEKLQALDICIRNRRYRMTLPLDYGYTSPRNTAFEPTFEALWTESAIAASILQRLPNLAYLQLAMVRELDNTLRPYDCRLREGSLRALFPGFQEHTAHLIDPPIFSAMRTMFFCSDEFHWALAKSPKLESLHLERPCHILPDEAPEEVNHAVKIFALAHRSSVFNPGVSRHKHISAFLAHFLFLDRLDWRIRDHEWDKHMDTREDVSVHQEGSYDVLLGLLQPVATCLTILNIGVDYELEDDSKPLNFLRHVLPCEGFKNFSHLKELWVPYQCLFDSAFPQASHTTHRPSALLPPSLTDLGFFFPRIALYDWLADFLNDREELPYVKEISLECRNMFGDTYDVFAFIFRNHPCVNTLHSLDIKLDVRNNSTDWKKEWDDYDLAALDLAAWQAKLGTPISGIGISL